MLTSRTNLMTWRTLKIRYRVIVLMHLGNGNLAKLHLGYNCFVFIGDDLILQAGISQEKTFRTKIKCNILTNRLLLTESNNCLSRNCNDVNSLKSMDVV